MNVATVEMNPAKNELKGNDPTSNWYMNWMIPVAKTYARKQSISFSFRLVPLSYSVHMLTTASFKVEDDMTVC